MPFSFVAVTAIATVVLLAYIGSGLYALAPGTAYLLVVGGIATLLLHRSFRSSPFTYVPPRPLVGAGLFNVALILFTLLSSTAARSHLQHLLSIGVYLLAFGLALVSLTGSSVSVALNRRVLGSGATVTLAIILVAQVTQLIGLWVPQGIAGDTGELGLTSRPGGLLNPNMTASVSLALFFLVVQLRSALPRIVIMAALAMLLVVLLISQSRGGTLMAAAYLILILWTARLSPLEILGPLLLTAALALLTVDNVSDIFLSAIALRLESDFSFGERLHLLRTGIELFSEKPLLGHGYRFMERSIGVSSHNELVEIAVNFGIAGSTLMWLAFVFLYPLTSLPFFIACLAPALLFSHNFFETSSLQAVIGVASAIVVQERRSLARA